MKPRKDGYYHKNFTYEGRRYHISAGTEKELMIKYGKMLQQLPMARWQQSKLNRTHWSEVWLDTYKAGNMTEKSLLTYRQKLDGYILPAIGRMKMKDVREPHLQRILNDEKGRSFSHVSKLRMVILQHVLQGTVSRYHQPGPVCKPDPSQDYQGNAPEPDRTRAGRCAGGGKLRRAQVRVAVQVPSIQRAAPRRGDCASMEGYRLPPQSHSRNQGCRKRLQSCKGAKNERRNKRCSDQS